MTIRNIVPRNNNEGQLGTENKKWNKIYTNEIFATNFTGNLTGTANNAIKDNKSQQIDVTYIKNISINNDTLTVTKGNDDSQNIVVNNISHAISSDNATNASKLQGLTTGNANGQIPINNGTENTNLNAALLNGKASSYFATSNHTHTTATQRCTALRQPYICKPRWNPFGEPSQTQRLTAFQTHGKVRFLLLRMLRYA